MRRSSREERADRTVDETGDQGLLLGRASLALEIAAGDLARGESLFLIVHGQREEVDPDTGLLRGDGGGEDGGPAILCENGAVRLAGDAAGLQPERTARPFDLYDVLMQHDFISTHRECGARAGSLEAKARVDMWCGPPAHGGERLASPANA